ncbi:histone-lysine N-methyltransferase, H3 lysine-9 specific SUVH4-like [Andrographis paniculata]|uniref:histone-lysine N-methyltransferase, H3 lysine-9 specific SUVH4-like n=1 Tax=Andrographis paniculata TaxID=175694 RepID=UPI0021E6FBCF|nr:histone-lysine N-methyltransferase, H3 lysine-9 specific SUVH4-like [Andrographis paniculata]XP_051137344.1 histone-lysine N-methyltransferase, H3 lysine-9 specific SUVH4-like [Andrographis paniculata]XP_051137345.1 histone-lysine N-methyltransferase, H3 lysine-9 specific SUVH4-like [Andrographis paniculata]XP_051137346.1 histone-lysine N-methyltransferase, H3 lysine-9 specific SUVH4-like [Andrographis paniculata]XP_051137347.1 histone-lysine N-methyltransferase, H3 lysine-9 specific SUVH4-l
MVMFSNGFISDDDENKLPLENGYAARYKPRKVSAVRDFPPRCGRDNVLVDTSPELNGANAGRNSDDAFMIEQQRNESQDFQPLGIQLHEEGVLNNPLEVERVESLDALVGKVTTTAMDGSLNDGEKLMMESECAGVNKLNESKRDSLKGTLLAQKDKYCRRRVSAIRDFPPNCGRNIPFQVDKNVKIEAESSETISRHVVEDVGMDEIKVNSQKECLVKIEVTETLNDRGRPLKGTIEDTDEGGIMDSEGCSKLALPGIEDTEEPPDVETVACTPGTNDEVWSPRSSFSTGDGSCREIAHGLMSASNCPKRKKRGAPNNSDSGRSGAKGRKQNLSRLKKSKAVYPTSNHEAEPSQGQSVKKDVVDGSYYPDGSPGSCTYMDEEYIDSSNESAPLITPISMTPGVIDHTDVPTGKEIVVYSPGKSDEMRHPHCVSGSRDVELIGSNATSDHPSAKGRRVPCNPGEKMSSVRKGKHEVTWRRKGKAVARKSTPKSKFAGSSSKRHNDIDKSTALALKEGEAYDHDDDKFLTKSHGKHKVMDIEVSLPPFGPKSSGNGDARNRVRETLRMFNAFCRKLLQQEESNSQLGVEEKLTVKKGKRIDLISAKMIKEIGKEVNTEERYLGQVPGVEVGDEFQYRVELAVIGIHRLYQAGIDWIKLDGVPVATSVVSSGAYDDDVENADVLIYCGQGGNVVGKSKQPEDQKLERGNLALKNSISAKTPVRVIRGWKEARVMDPLDPKSKMVTTYVYDGLYTVKRYWEKEGPHGKQVFMFELRRQPGQPELAWKQLKKSNKFKSRPGMVVNDIAGGVETIPIFAVNTIDDGKPPPFKYVRKMMYPGWFKPNPPAGCDCTGRCSGSKKCRCAVKNGGEIPYNHNGAIVETKPLVYECGPHCRCPPNCYNRVTQRGIKFQLEIFKTESRGWGVRALTSIPSGSFICEYAGELLEDKEAEERIGNDEYLFDIGQNYSDTSVMPHEKAALVELMEGGYTIDAAQYGNVGRFINHSCSPNLYAQNVIYDHDDKKMPHVMLFAMENIPPLKELTYHYNYSVDQIRDANGNIKVKRCFCGSAECTGRMY